MANPVRRSDPEPQSASPPVLSLSGVSLAFRGMPVLTDIDLELRAGEYVGLIGPNGGGKSVLLKVILGLLEPDSGTVEVFGEAPDRAAGRVAYVPQYPTFERSFPITVLDVVMMGRLANRRPFRRRSAQDFERARAALERVGMGAHEARQIGKLSGGQLQRVVIARALATDARLFLLDEPMSALDPKSQSDLYELMGELAQEHTVIVVSHDIGLIGKHVRSIGCLNQCLHYHPASEVTSEIIEATYGCPVDFVVHRHEHRVLDDHGHAHDAGHDHGTPGGGAGAGGGGPGGAP